MSLRGIDHVQLAMPAGREAEARRFYVGALGIPERPKPANLAARGGCWFEDGDLKVHLGVDPEFRPARKAHPAFLVEGLGALRTSLTVGGFELRDDEPLEGYDRVYVTDPFGNRIELMEPRTSALKASADRLNLRDAFEIEFARREMDRRSREEADRRQHEADLAAAEQLFGALTRDPAFLADHGLTADQRRYTVALDHASYRIAAYFEGGVASITLAEKPTAVPGALPRRHETAQGVEEALRIIAQFLVDETR